MSDTHLIIDELNKRIDAYKLTGDERSPVPKVMRHAVTRLTDFITWKPIDTMVDELKSKPVIVGYFHMGVWVIRSAWWSNGDDWEAGNFESRDAAAGWWSVETAAVQDKVEPTHWLMPTPNVG